MSARHGEGFGGSGEDLPLMKGRRDLTLGEGGKAKRFEATPTPKSGSRLLGCMKARNEANLWKIGFPFLFSSKNTRQKKKKGKETKIV